MAFQHIEDAARAALSEYGLLPPKHFKYDTFQVVDAEDGKKGNGAGRVKIFADGKGGIVQNWKTGAKGSFFLNADSKAAALSDAECQRIERERRKRQAEEVARMDRAARRALSMWQAATPAPANHSYLIAKQIKPHGSRVGKWKRVITSATGEKKTIIIEDALLIPLSDAAGKIRSLQAIFPVKHPLFERNKDFLPGGGLAGLFGWIGARTETVIICEGYLCRWWMFRLKRFFPLKVTGLMITGALGRLCILAPPKKTICGRAFNFILNWLVIYHAAPFTALPDGKRLTELGIT